MSDDKIQPITDPEDGIPICSMSCPSYLAGRKGVKPVCNLGNEDDTGDVCPHAVRRMARELDEAKAGLALLAEGWWVDNTQCVDFDMVRYVDAMDLRQALKKERENETYQH